MYLLSNMILCFAAMVGLWPSISYGFASALPERIPSWVNLLTPRPLPQEHNPHCIRYLNDSSTANMSTWDSRITGLESRLDLIDRIDHKLNLDTRVAEIERALQRQPNVERSLIEMLLKERCAHLEKPSASLPGPPDVASAAPAGITAQFEQRDYELAIVALITYCLSLYLARE
ncbi:PREDICTED: uncharacterized protein LOC105561354 [Vollenhovia emeryi]|uniref:uncharacterized protein LOC105561354 n=1 Tax=Vollenhovia emeryi TaxID=411798 RepID=UPI0005F3D8CE|nr:PREDICTED: uncharacterized protein LOC105561354 [Vollenhovia emeryi]